MLRVLAVLLLNIVATAALADPAPDGAALERLLAEFLAGASRNDSTVHKSFWADDLVYTSSAGRRFGKAEILQGVRTAPPPQPGDPVTEYSAEDVRIQQYDGTAVVAFRLVGKTRQADSTQVRTYFNTGTFVRRDGKWQAVAWQATLEAETSEP